MEFEGGKIITKIKRTMGRIDSGLLKGFSGQVGDLIVYGYNGNTYVRRKPKRVMRCDAVLEQQERIAGVAALYRAVKEGGLLPIWEKAAQGSGLTAYNWFVRANQKCFTKEGAGFAGQVGACALGGRGVGIEVGERKYLSSL